MSREGDRPHPLLGGSVPPVVEEGALFEGLVAFRGHARVEGCIRGEVLAWGTLEIGARGRVEGRVDAHEARVAGLVEGDIHARDRIELLPGATVVGDLDAPRLALSDGCRVVGRVKTRDAA